MKRERTIGGGIAVIAAVLLCTGTAGHAQGGASSSGAAAGGSAASTGSVGRTVGRDTSPLNPENSLQLIKPADRAEESAFRDFQHVSTENMPRKIELGEKFLKKYPKSGYRAIVYLELTSAYLLTNQVQKMEESGEMAIALNPKDVQVLAMLGQTIPRVITANTPESESSSTRPRNMQSRRLSRWLCWRNQRKYRIKSLRRRRIKLSPLRTTDWGWSISTARILRAPLRS